MQFMVELKHTPENCVASRSELERLEVDPLSRAREEAPKHGARLIDGWAFPVGHQLWYVIDAPDSHVAADVFFALGVHKWNTVTINPVLDHDTFSREVLGATSKKSTPPAAIA